MNEKPEDSDRVFVMLRGNYKVYADLGPEKQRIEPVLAILDTGAGPNFIRRSEFPEGMEDHLKFGSVTEVCDANGKPL